MSRPVLRRVYTEKEIDRAAMKAAERIVAGLQESIAKWGPNDRHPVTLTRRIRRDIADWFRIVQPRQKVTLK